MENARKIRLSSSWSDFHAEREQRDHAPATTKVDKGSGPKPSLGAAGLNSLLFPAPASREFAADPRN
jgi:hypothetical protein